MTPANPAAAMPAHPHILHPAWCPGTPRLHGWAARLAGWLAVCRNTPFEWGEHDCARFVAGAIHAMTGCTIALPPTPSARAALRTLQALGGLQAATCRELGAPIPTARAGVGDVLLIAPQGRPALALCGGTHAISTGPLGLARLGLPQAGAIAAWRV